MDPLADMYLSSSVYNYTLNNPIKYTDPNGMNVNSINSTHIDEDGNVIVVYDDGDTGIYVHPNGTTTEDVDEKRKKTNTTSGGGYWAGNTFYWDEFVQVDKYGNRQKNSDGSYKPIPFANI